MYIFKDENQNKKSDYITDRVGDARSNKSFPLFNNQIEI